MKAIYETLELARNNSIVNCCELPSFRTGKGYWKTRHLMLKNYEGVRVDSRQFLPVEQELVYISQKTLILNDSQSIFRILF